MTVVYWYTLVTWRTVKYFYTSILLLLPNQYTATASKALFLLSLSHRANFFRPKTKDAAGNNGSYLLLYLVQSC